jgi:hypothetical protein
VLKDWSKPFLKTKKEFDNSTMLQQLKIEVAEELSLNPLYLQGALAASSYIDKVKIFC